MSRPTNRWVAYASVLLLIAACTTAPGPTGTALPPLPTASPTPAPTASPSPTAAPTLPPTPTAAPTQAPTATAAAGHPVIELFLSDFAALQPPFHVFTDISGTVSAGGQQIVIAFTVEGDISGQDFDGRMSGSAIGRTLDAKIIFADGVAYHQSNDGSWREFEDFQQTQPLNPFSRLNASDLTYGGTVTRDGRTLHQLTTETWIGEAIENVEGMPDAQLEGSTFDIFVDDDGTPAEADLEFTIVATVSGQPARIDYVVDYEFTNVGVPVTIEAPTIE